MMFEKTIGDLKAYKLKYQNFSFAKEIFYLCFSQEFLAVLVYRFGHWASYHLDIPIVKHLMKIMYFFMGKVSEMLFNVRIWPESEIGPGFRIEHCGSIFIRANIGKNCRVQQQTTIGYRGGFKGGGVPTLGDNVYVGAGAKILGEVKIGDNAKIGANAVVLKDIPNNALAVGVPAKVKKILP